MMLANTIRCLYSQSEGWWLDKSRVVGFSSYLDEVVRDRQIYTASTALFRHGDTDQWSEMKDRKSTRLNSSHRKSVYTSLCLSILCVKILNLRFFQSFFFSTKYKKLNWTASCIA